MTRSLLSNFLFWGGVSVVNNAAEPELANIGKAQL